MPPTLQRTMETPKSSTKTQSETSDENVPQISHPTRLSPTGSHVPPPVNHPPPVNQMRIAPILPPVYNEEFVTLYSWPEFAHQWRRYGLLKFGHRPTVSQLASLKMSLYASVGGTMEMDLSFHGPGSVAFNDRVSFEEYLIGIKLIVLRREQKQSTPTSFYKPTPLNDGPPYSLNVQSRAQLHWMNQ